MIITKGVTKEFRIHKKEPGLKASLKALFVRNWQQKYALRDVDFCADQGEMVGLLGSNGAGKTTLVKICTGIINATKGDIRVLGFDPWERKNEFRKQIALIMGQKAQLWWDLPAGDCFLLLKEIYSIPTKQFHERLTILTELMKLGDLLTTQIRRLSLGERMKMELVAALLHAPKIIFLDEPTIGLDITSQRALRHFILDYHKEHKPTVVVTSHYMEDIESLCKRIVILREGRAVYDGGLRELVNKYATHRFVNLTLADEQEWNASAQPHVLTDLHSDLPKAWGEIVSLSASEIKLKVDRFRVSEISSAMLQRFKIADLNISDVDVATIVSQIQDDGAHPS